MCAIEWKVFPFSQLLIPAIVSDPICCMVRERDLIQLEADLCVEIVWVVVKRVPR